MCTKTRPWRFEVTKVILIKLITSKYLYIILIKQLGCLVNNPIKLLNRFNNGKTLYFRVKMDIKIPTLADTIASNKGRHYGAGGGTRTHTDFSTRF